MISCILIFSHGKPFLLNSSYRYIISRKEHKPILYVKKSDMNENFIYFLLIYIKNCDIVVTRIEIEFSDNGSLCKGHREIRERRDSDVVFC